MTSKERALTAASGYPRRVTDILAILSSLSCTSQPSSQFCLTSLHVAQVSKMQSSDAAATDERKTLQVPAENGGNRPEAVAETPEERRESSASFISRYDKVEALNIFSERLERLKKSNFDLYESIEQYNLNLDAYRFSTALWPMPLPLMSNPIGDGKKLGSDIKTALVLMNQVHGVEPRIHPTLLSSKAKYVVESVFKSEFAGPIQNTLSITIPITYKKDLEVYATLFLLPPPPQ